MAAGIEFEDDKGRYGTPAYMKSRAAGPSGIAGWLMRRGFAKSEQSAQIIQIAIIVVNLVLAFLLVKAFT